MALSMEKINRLLEHIRHQLPAQGPIKEFIHHNTLHAFQHFPFHEAKKQAAAFYQAHIDLPLKEYRDFYAQGKIRDDALREAILKSTLHQQGLSLDVIHQALFHYVEIKDTESFEAILLLKHLDASKIHLLAQSYQDLACKEERPRLSLRALLKSQNEKAASIDDVLNPILFRLTASYLDQGIGLLSMASLHATLLGAVAQLLEDSFLPLAPFISKKHVLGYLQMQPEQAIDILLHKLVGDETLYERYLSETLMVHPGWSGMVASIEANPASLSRHRAIRLVDFVALKLVLEDAFMSAYVPHFKPLSLCKPERSPLAGEDRILLKARSLALFAQAQLTQTKVPAAQDMLLLDAVSLCAIWHEALEQTYYQEVLAQLKNHGDFIPSSSQHTYNMQAVFCIDDRECSLRRYIEEFDPHIETFAAAGFFGVDFMFQSLNDARPVKMCPLPVTPKHVVREFVAQEHQAEFVRQKAESKKTAQALLNFHDASSSLLSGFLLSGGIGHLSLWRLLMSFLKPRTLLQKLTTKKIAVPTQLSLSRKEDAQENGLWLGFSEAEMGDRVFAVLRNIGMTENLTPLVIVIAHGSSSANNPHFAAYDCGACSGRPGAPNARTFAAMANMPAIREYVAKKAS